MFVGVPSRRVSLLSLVAFAAVIGMCLADCDPDIVFDPTQCTSCLTCTTVIIDGKQLAGWVSDTDKGLNTPGTGKCLSLYYFDSIDPDFLKPLDQAPFCSFRVFSTCNTSPAKYASQVTPCSTTPPKPTPAPRPPPATQAPTPPATQPVTGGSAILQASTTVIASLVAAIAVCL
jgi:hypothetical protein